jgi:uncharacterized protein (TIGR03437 family)
LKLSLVTALFAVLTASAQTLPAPGVFPLEFPLIDSPVLYGLLNTSPLRSDDRGATWTPLYVSPQGATQNVSRLIVHPDRPLIVYARLARSNGGLFRSQDGGRTWAPFTTGLPATGEILDPVILRGAGESARLRIADTLYTLDPTTSSWTRLADLPPNTTVLAFDLANPQRAAVLARSGTFYFSSNAGQSWELRSRIMQDPRKYGRQILFDPKSDSIVFVRAEAETDQNNRCDAPGGGLWRSGDTGRTFVNVYSSNLCNVSPFTFIDPNRPNVYLRTGFAGQPYCTSADRGASFACTNEPLSTNPPYLIAMDPRNGDLYRERLSLISRDGANSWQPSSATFRPTLRTFPETAATVAQGETTNLNITLGLAEGSFAIPYQATTSGEPWLTLGAASGNLNASLAVRISAADLVPGVYRASIRLTSSLTVNPSTTIPLTVTVTPQALSSVRYSFQRLAGGSANNSATIVEGASALSQPLNSITGAARDSQGNLYVMTNRRLRRISPNGAIQTIAGDGQQGTTADNTPAAQARFNFVSGVAVAGDGTIYVTDTLPARIYAITGSTVRVVADNTFVIVPGNFPTRLGNPRDIATSPQGTVFVLDGIALLRLNGTRPPEVALVLQNFTSQVGSPSLFNLYAESNNSFLFSSSTSHRIFRLAGGRLTVLAGTGTAGLSGDGGPAPAANLNRPTALAPDGEGNILFYDGSNSVLRLIRPDGTIFTVSSSSFTNSTFSANSGSVRDTRFGIVAAILPTPSNAFVVFDSNGAFAFTRQSVASPVIQSGSAVNAGSFTDQISPGSLFSLYGANLAFDTQAASSTPLPTRLAGAEILVNGQPIPIAFASPGQVNAQIPPGTPVGPARLQARVDGNLSAEITIDLAPAAPGIFVYGDNRAVAQNQDGGINGPDTPELPGRFAVLYLTGIGATTVPVAPGAPSPTDPLAFAAEGATLQVGDTPANVLFTGLTPGFVGLAQINFQVPELPAGDYPLTVTIGGNPSNAPLFRIGTP